MSLFNIRSIWKRQKKTLTAIKNITLEYAWEWKKGIWVFFREKAWSLAGIFLSPNRSWHWRMIGFHTPQVTPFPFLFFWSVFFSNSGQYGRVFVQETKVLLDYSPTIMTINLKWLFAAIKSIKYGIHLRKLRIFVCTMKRNMYLLTEWDCRTGKYLARG